MYVPLPKYPAITRDFAIVVKEDVLVKEIENIILANGEDLLESYKLFDVYQGDQISKGYKSVAYTLTYRHKERTLKDAEVNAVHNRILKAMNEKIGAVLRD